MKRSEDDFKAEIEAHIALEADQLKAENIEGGALRAMPALELPMPGMHH